MSAADQLTSPAKPLDPWAIDPETLEAWVEDCWLDCLDDEGLPFFPTKAG